MGSDDLRVTLERVGERFDLGEYEIDAYLAVLEHGELTASEIAEQTDIPQPRVYDTVRSLGDRGLVELRESRPMTVVAVDPTEAFDDLESSLTKMIDELEARFTAPARDTEAVSLVRSRGTILRYLEEVVESASYELALSVTPALLERFEAELSAAVERGAHVDLLLSPAVDAPDAGEYDYGAVCTSARTRRGITTPVIAVADGEHSVYATQDALRDDRDRYGVIFNRSALGFLLTGFFGTVLWTTSDELYAGPPDGAFPRTYASVRRCVSDVASVEGRLYAAVRGRTVDAGEQVVVRGEVVDATVEPTQHVATLTLDTGAERLTVGGQVAALEDVEAHEIRVGRDEPPAVEY